MNPRLRAVLTELSFWLLVAVLVVSLVVIVEEMIEDARIEEARRTR